MKIRVVHAFVICCMIQASVEFTATAQSAFNSFSGFGGSSNEPIQIEAMELEVLDQEKKAVFTGNVVVVQGKSSLETELLHVHYDGNGTDQQNISKIEATGGVVVESEDQRATSDEAVFDTATELLIMTGEEVVLTQGSNVIVGNLLRVELNTGKAKMTASEGKRVKLLLDNTESNTSQ